MLVTIIGICIGYASMRQHESPDTPFTILRTRFEQGMKSILHHAAHILSVSCFLYQVWIFFMFFFYQLLLLLYMTIAVTWPCMPCRETLDSSRTLAFLSTGSTLETIQVNHQLFHVNTAQTSQLYSYFD